MGEIKPEEKTKKTLKKYHSVQKKVENDILFLSFLFFSVY